MTSDRAKAGYLMVIGSIAFFSGWKIAEFLRPEYSVSQDVISALGVGENAYVFNASVIFLGLLGVLSAYLLRNYDKVFSVILAITGFAAMGVGIFPMDNPVPHALASVATFLFSGILELYSVKLESTGLRYIWLILGLVTLASLILFVTGNYLGIGRGGMERFIVYPPIFWLIGFGVGLIKSG